MKENLFMRAEDDLDFMPIIPLNETDNENLNDIEIPKELPVLPLRNTVLFPGVVLPITVGRDKSIKAVTDAYKADRLIGVLAQKDSTIEDPTVTDLEDVGTVARIIKLIKMPDGGTTVILQGKRRFKVGAVTAEDPYFKAQVVLLQEEEAPKEQDFEAYVSNIKDLAAQIIQLSPNIPSEASIILKNIENPSFLIHFVSSNLNSDLKQKQRLLEISDLKERAELLMNLMHTELQYAELKNKVTNKTRAELDKQQREYFEISGDNYCVEASGISDMMTSKVDHATDVVRLIGRDVEIGDVVVAVKKFALAAMPMKPMTGAELNATHNSERHVALKLYWLGFWKRTASRAIRS